MMQPASPTSLLGKAFAVVAGAILLVLGVMFSLALVAVIAVVGLAALVYFLWKTRHLRRAMKEMQAQAPDGQVIEGEAIVVEEYRASERPLLPGDSGKT